MSKDYRTILNEMLEEVDDTLDKRQGSIIYDALAPAAMKMAEEYAELEIFYNQTYLLTATGENLDNRVADYGLTRIPATYAIRIVNVYNENDELYDIDIGTIFSIPTDAGGYNYTLTEKLSTGVYKAICDTTGTVGNTYIGILLPIYNINNLGKAQMVGTFQAGEDIEDDNSLRARALNKLNKDAFGGNQADYKRYMSTIDGIGPVKIFPIWNGGGTVKLSFLNSDYTIPDNTFINEVQTLIDPTANHGEGIGLAPIGHTVTVVAPILKSFTVAITLSLVAGTSMTTTLQEKIEYQINKYIQELIESWENATSLVVYRSKISAYILQLEEIANVSQVKLDNNDADLILTETAQTQEIPKITTITINS